MRSVFFKASLISDLNALLSRKDRGAGIDFTFLRK